MKEYRCPKCNSKNLFVKKAGNNTGLYCGDCGAWIKWIGKNELRAFEYLTKQKHVDDASSKQDDIASIIYGAFTGLELAKLAIMQKELKEYKDLEEQGLLVRLPCKAGDIVYVDSTILPIENMECYEDTGNKIPSYFQGRVVSFRFAQRNWVKIAVKAKWLYEWIDDETGPESDYIEREKNFTIPLSMIGKSVFLTREEAGGDEE